MNANMELISYKEYPQDKYVKAICTILIEGKYCVSFGKKAGKEGQSWWKPASFSLDDGSCSKKYVECFSMDSYSENEKIMEFVRYCERKQFEKKPALPQILAEVANNEALPF